VRRPFAPNATVRYLEVGGKHLSKFCVIEFFDYIFIFKGIEKGKISRCFVALSLLFSGFKSSISMSQQLIITINETMRMKVKQQHSK
jgi:hypothetical protein